MLLKYKAIMGRINLETSSFCHFKIPLNRVGFTQKGLIFPILDLPLNTPFT